MRRLTAALIACFVVCVLQPDAALGAEKVKKKKTHKKAKVVKEPEPETAAEPVPETAPEPAPAPEAAPQPQQAAQPAEGGEEDEAWLQGKEKQEIPPPAKPKTASLEEDPKKWYFGIGVLLRMHIAPDFLYKFAADGAYTEVGYGVGIQGTFRLKGLDIIPSIWFHDLSHEPAVMKEPGDPDTEKEYIINNMRLIMITVDFLQSVRILRWLSFFFGAGVGIGIPVTRIERWEATASGDKCIGPGNPPSGEYCETGGGHYGVNDPWPVYPYLNILLGLRFKPIPNFVCTFDFGIGTGFILGTRASYIF